LADLIASGPDNSEIPDWYEDEAGFQKRGQDDITLACIKPMHSLSAFLPVQRLTGTGGAA
jgi:hypothetical protein